MSDLDRAIDRLYEVFRAYELPASVPYCDHCHDESEVVLVRSTKLRDLGPEDIGHQVFDLVSTFGDLETFKYLLPRILEITVRQGWADAGSAVDLPIVFGKFAHATWSTWPPHEREAVQDWVQALWIQALAREPGEWPDREPGDVLVGLGRAYDSLAPFLAEWETFPTSHAAEHLARYVLGHSIQLRKKGTLGGAFWGDRPEVEAQVLRWLRSARVLERLEAFSGTDAFEDWDRSQLDVALDVLRGPA